MNDIITEKNELQKAMNEVCGKLERNEYGISENMRDRFQAVLSHTIPYAGEVSLSGEKAEVKNLLLEMIDCMKTVLILQDEDASEAILKSIIEGVDYLRRTDITMSGLTDRDRASRQQKVIDRLNLLVQIQSGIVTVKRRISKLEENQRRADSQLNTAQNALMRMKNTSPTLKDELIYFKNHGEIVSTELLEYIRHMNELTRSDNLRRKNAVVLERQRDVQIRLESILFHLNMIMFGSPELLGNIQLDRLKHVAEDFKRDLMTSKEEENAIRGVMDDIDSTIEEIGRESVKEKMDAIKNGQALHDRLLKELPDG